MYRWKFTYRNSASPWSQETYISKIEAYKAALRVLFLHTDESEEVMSIVVAIGEPK